MPMTTSAAGRAAIAQREGIRLRAYKDSVGVWTIGVGHSGRASPPPVTRGMTITKAQADKFLIADLRVFEGEVNRLIKVSIGQNAFDALVSLDYNIGGGNFAKSTVVREVNAGNMRAAADAFLDWEKPAVLRGRRIAERAQFLTPDHKLGAEAPKAWVAEAQADAASAPPVHSPGPLKLASAIAPDPKLGWLARLWIKLTFRKQD